PLEPGKIRVLKVLPDALWTDHIVCELRNVPLYEARVQRYTALSYYWGPPSQPRHTIIVNYRNMVIGEQLFNALTYLRSPTESRDLWIDAICIRQDDNDEKSQQLPMMGDIYTFAESVNIWLGIDADDSSYAL
ncbi:HET-domain-containing protein, partial [Lentithecium fluviatile CBS 122367]